ncbi:Colorectal mutant cancer protein [Clonorchis sinensis]|uniref:Colorectal mutant cancer protein n=1 Tax=Clonorchis sinensis TaxID=79923 RepID=A0A8T1M7Z9_CLOSI|nr:Colorectal mutant cancer protein [Clonorchis sinensis]
MFDQLWLEAEDSVLRGPLSPRALLQFLSSLSKLAPYPRLADVANCAQLTWSRLLATLSCLQSDCLVLQTNLAEVKATADRIQCQMNQIDANWSAALRCASLADSCLEVADCLNQLYCTELAIVLYRQNRKMLISGRGCSTLSSSTSSSSFPGRHIKASGGSSNGISKSINQMPSTTAPSLSSTSPYHPYAVYAVPGSIGTESNDISSIGLSAVHLTLKNLKLYRHQAELVAHSLLDRYDLTDTNPERIYPITSSTNGGLPSLSRAFSRPPQAPLSPGIFSTINSPPCPNIPSTHSLTNTSLYANSWYVSLGRLGHSAALTTAAHCEQTSLGSCAGSGSLLSKPAGITLLPFSPARNSTKSSGHHSNAVPEMSGGWQTPDSGAGSSGTNEVLQQPTLLHHPFFPTFGCLAPGVCHTEPNPYSTLLDLLPPLWANPLHRNDEHLICVDTDSDSSDSSDAISTAATGSKIPEPVDASDPHALHLSTWTRAEERKLRGLLHYLMHSRRLVQSTMADMHMFATNSEEENESRRTCESVKSQEEFGRLLSSSAISSLGKLSLNVLIENSVLLQELCHVKEERADLNARLYLLEKELHANRLALESHMAAEQALRAHLDVLVTEQNYRLQKTDGSAEVDKTVCLRTGQSETSLLRGQVKNLLQALEALRHSTELQQLQSEELVDDLKRANTALIGAFDKAKHKYLTRIRKLEDQIGSISNSTSEKRTVLPKPVSSCAPVSAPPDNCLVSTRCKESMINIRNKSVPPTVRPTTTIRSTNAVNMVPYINSTIPSVPVQGGSLRLSCPDPVQLSRPLPAIPHTQPPKPRQLTPAHIPKPQHTKGNTAFPSNKIPPGNMLPPQRAP